MYYPKSQIKTNLYTNGGEYVLFTTKEEYKGYFYKVSTGRKYTGKNPENPPNILLIKLTSNDSIIDTEPSQNQKQITLNDGHREPSGDLLPFYYPRYSENQQYSTPRFLPKSNPTIPTEKDYKFEEFQRYFAKKNNELRYLEIDRQTYILLSKKKKTVAWDLYSSLTVTWELAGNEEQAYKINKNMVELAEKTNKWYGFTQWFKGKFSKYHINPGSQSDLSTDGTEFINRRTKQPYKGPYHIHPEKGPMVGADHVSPSHDYLDPIQVTPSTSTSSPSYPSSGGSISSGGGGRY